ncbi:heavy metal translocating P-type ATPase [Pseudohalocynthiibacter aestuariivivens]|uniref:Heavy metal translocating P-type ATPase n=1 Tax=Pseudohalocynthiibacter aestuariivivens TaxID=1591409 RepID=A0ABV5JCB0_9RHOB|nr:copper-translocating P-type ATPase [Pseudohalocynthiibacter aestuariivivens]
MPISRLPINVLESIVSGIKKTDFQLEGMSCASCVGRVEKALRSIPGVSEANVNLARESASVSYSAPASLSQVSQALSAAGYPLVADSITFEINGMTCFSCVGRVEKALLAKTGVVDASVNLASETALIRYIPGEITISELSELLVETGYPGTPAEENLQPTVDRKLAEIEQLQRVTLIAAALALPVFVIEMGGHLIPQIHAWISQTLGHQTSWIIQFLLTSAVLLGPGRSFYTKGFPALFKGTPDMNSLVALGTSAAYGFSIVSTFFPSLLPSGSQNVYYEAAAVIVVLILLGRLLEARAKGRTGAAIRRLLQLQPKTARVMVDGKLEERSVDALVVGDIVETRPGERIAIDGEITEGSSFVDESMISGEPVPVQKQTGDAVIGGTVNTTGAFLFKATKIGKDTMLAQIVQMVSDAQGAKLPIQSLVDRITAWFVPAVLAAAAVTILVWLLIGPSPALQFALVTGVAVLIIACPCAMGLATPTSIMVGTGRAAELGVLFKKGDALQILQDVDVVAFDKTGTLTEGQPRLTNIMVAEGFEESDFLRLVGAAETKSEHPIATAIVNAARRENDELPKPENFLSVTGYGVGARVEGKELLVGADRLLRQQGIDLAGFEDIAKAWAERGKTPLFAAIDGQIAGALAIADPIKPSTPSVIGALHKLGLKVAMITGDNQATANAIADELGIDYFSAEILPDGKVAALKSFAEQGLKVAFVGDGINDAPALAAADVGIAVGTGTDIAIEAAHVVLMSGDLAGVANAFDVSQRTMRNIRQNLFWAFGYNVLLIPVAAGVLYPVNGMLLSPVLAAGAMAFSSVFVLSNALRLRWMNPMSLKVSPTPYGGTKIPSPAE